MTVITLDGELDISRRSEIGDALRVPAAASALLVDFSNATYADSTTLAELMRFRSEAQAAKVPVALVVATRQLSRLIDYAGLNGAFTIFSDRGTALTYLASQANQ